MRNLFTVVLIWFALFAAGAARAEVTLFNGDPIAATGITLSGWGSGTAVEASERAWEGSRSIKMTIQGLHEGAKIAFKEPVELVEPTSGENDYLQFILGFAAVVPLGQSSFIGPGFGVRSSPDAIISPAVSDYYYYEAGVHTRPKVNRLRVLLESADGRGIEYTADVPSEPEEGWYKVAFPFKVLGLAKGGSFKVAWILLFTDLPDTVYVGQIGTVHDTSPIDVLPLDDQVVAVGDTVFFEASASGGAAMLRYSWNFGDGAKEGEDATGQVVSHVYRRGGELEVKLTVSDYWGIKKPVTITCEVTVND